MTRAVLLCRAAMYALLARRAGASADAAFYSARAEFAAWPADRAPLTVRR